MEGSKDVMMAFCRAISRFIFPSIPLWDMKDRDQFPELHGVSHNRAK